MVRVCRNISLFREVWVLLPACSAKKYLAEYPHFLNLIYEYYYIFCNLAKAPWKDFNFEFINLPWLWNVFLYFFFISLLVLIEASRRQVICIPYRNAFYCFGMWKICFSEKMRICSNCMSYELLVILMMIKDGCNNDEGICSYIYEDSWGELEIFQVRGTNTWLELANRDKKSYEHAVRPAKNVFVDSWTGQKSCKQQ